MNTEDTDSKGIHTSQRFMFIEGQKHHVEFTHLSIGSLYCIGKFKNEQYIKYCVISRQSKNCIMENLSIFSYLSLSFSFGLLSLLTPCVFPLIPITVSYFTKRQESEHARPAFDAFLYSLGIILSFSIVGFLIAALFGASGLNRLASNPYMNLIIAVVFIVFAFNLF